MIAACNPKNIQLAPFSNYNYDANGNLVTGDSYYREYNEFNQLSRIREGNISNGPVLEEFVWHPVQEKILIKDVFYNGVKNYTIYYVSDDFIRIENSSGNFTENLRTSSNPVKFPECLLSFKD